MPKSQIFRNLEPRARYPAEIRGHSANRAAVVPETANRGVNGYKICVYPVMPLPTTQNPGPGAGA